MPAPSATTRGPRNRGLEWADVRAVLDEFMVRYEVGPLGFTVRATVMHGYRNPDDDWRLRCGSGIAGRGGHWTLVRVNRDCAISAATSTKDGLRRALREHLAGAHPDPDHRDRWYATRHRTRLSSGHCIWKPKKHGTSIPEPH